MPVVIIYQEGDGCEQLVRDPLRPTHLVWRPF